MIYNGFQKLDYIVFMVLNTVRITLIDNKQEKPRKKQVKFLLQKPKFTNLIFTIRERA